MKSLKFIETAKFLSALCFFLCCVGKLYSQQESYARPPENMEASNLIKKAHNAKLKNNFYEYITNLQKVIEQFSNYVYKVDTGLYRGLAEYCKDELFSLDEEQAKKYRELYETKAKLKLDTAIQLDDERSILQVFKKFPLTDSARKALNILAFKSIEQGNYEDAVFYFETLSNIPPKTLPPEDVLSYVKILFLTNKKDDLMNLKEKVKRYTKMWDLEKTEKILNLISETEKKLSVNIVPKKGNLSYWDWGEFYGCSKRNALASSVEDIGSKSIWNFSLSQTTKGWQDWSYYGDRFLLDFSMLAQSYPVVVGGVVYVNNGVSAYALDSFNGNKLWEYKATVKPDNILYEPRIIYSATYYNGYVFMNLVHSYTKAEEEVRFGGLSIKQGFPYRTLVAFDSLSGDIVWKIGGSYYGQSEDDPLSFHTAPAVDEKGLLYVGAVKMLTKTDPATHYVYCIDYKTGKVVWKTFVASGFLELNLFNNPVTESIGSSVTISGNKLLYCTNLGVIACLDKKNGSIIWIKSYPQLKLQGTNNLTPTLLPLTWLNNPILVVSTKSPSEKTVVICTPMDSNFLFALDAETGNILWTVPQDLNPEGNSFKLRFIIGVKDDTLILQGSGGIAVFSIFAEELKLIWRDKYKEFFQGQKENLHRAILAKDGLYISGFKSMRVVDTDTKKLLREEQISPGSIVIGDGILFSITGNNISAYYNKSQIKKIADTAKSQAQDDPNILYVCALFYLGSNEYEKAIQCLSDLKNFLSSSLLRREVRVNATRCLFQTYIRYAEKLYTEKNFPKAIEFYNKAQTIFPDEPNIDIQLKIVNCYEELAKQSEAIIMYTNLILQNEKTLKAEKIDKIVGRIKSLCSNPQAKKRFKEFIFQKLSEATSIYDSDTIVEFVRLFPFTEDIYSELNRLGEQFFNVKKFKEAIDLFTVVIENNNDKKLLLATLPKLYKCYLELGMLRDAKDLLSILLEDYPNERIFYENKEFKVKDFVKMQLKEGTITTGATEYVVPEIKIPLTKLDTLHFTNKIDKIFFDNRNELDSGWFAIFSGGKLVLYSEDVKRIRELQDLPSTPLAVLSYDNKSFIIVTRELILRLNVDGKIMWRHIVGRKSVYAFDIVDDEMYVIGAEDFGRKVTLFRIELERGTQNMNDIPLRSDEGFKIFPVGRYLICKSLRTVQIIRLATKIKTTLNTSYYIIEAIPIGIDKILIVEDRGKNGNSIECFVVNKPNPIWTITKDRIVKNSVVLHKGNISFVTVEQDGYCFSTVDAETGLFKSDWKFDDGILLEEGIRTDSERMYLLWADKKNTERKFITAFDIANNKRLWQSDNFAREGSVAYVNSFCSKDFLIVELREFKQEKRGEAITSGWAGSFFILDNKTGKLMESFTDAVKGNIGYIELLLHRKFIFYVQEDKLNVYGKKE